MKLGFVPLITYDELSEVDPLDPDYVSGVLAASSTSGGFRRLLSQPGEARTLLEALLRQSAAAEYVIGSVLLVLDHELTTNVIAELPVHARVVDREVLGISANVLAGPDSDGVAFSSRSSSGQGGCAARADDRDGNQRRATRKRRRAARMRGGKRRFSQAAATNGHLRTTSATPSGGPVRYPAADHADPHPGR